MHLWSFRPPPHVSFRISFFPSVRNLLPLGHMMTHFQSNKKSGYTFKFSEKGTFFIEEEIFSQNKSERIFLVKCWSSSTMKFSQNLFYVLSGNKMHIPFSERNVLVKCWLSPTMFLSGMHIALLGISPIQYPFNGEKKFNGEKVQWSKK